MQKEYLKKNLLKPFTEKQWSVPLKLHDNSAAKSKISYNLNADYLVSSNNQKSLI